MAYPTPTAKRKQTFMLFGYPSGVQGNVVSAGVNEFIVPNYKQTWGEHPEDRRRPRRRAAPQLQVDRICVVSDLHFPSRSNPAPYFENRRRLITAPVDRDVLIVTRNVHFREGLKSSSVGALPKHFLVGRIVSDVLTAPSKFWGERRF